MMALYQGINSTNSLIGIFDAFIHLIITHGFRYVLQKTTWKTLSFLKLAVRVVPATFILAVLAKFIVAAFMWWPLGLFDKQPFYFNTLIVAILQSQIILIVWSLIYFSFHYFRNYKSAEIEKWKLEAVLKDAELTALKTQVNPHFLFNCLNNIRALVLEDTEKARDAITKLSDLLRYSIQYNQKQKVTLREEIAIVKQYLALEGIHMDSRLNYTFHIDNDALESEIPPMIVQLLAENAIKHCLSKIPEGGFIKIDVSKTIEALMIQVTNTGQISATPSDSTGLGLRNARERLNLLFGDQASLRIENLDRDNVIAAIHIPLS